MFKNLTPQKKKVLLIGGAIVAIFALYLYMRSKSSAESPEALAEKHREEAEIAANTYPSAYSYPYTAAGTPSGTMEGGEAPGETGPAGPAGPTGEAGPQGEPGSPASPPGPENKTKTPSGHTKSPGANKAVYAAKATRLEKYAAAQKKKGHKAAARKAYKQSQKVRRAHHAPKK